MASSSYEDDPLDDWKSHQKIIDGSKKNSLDSDEEEDVDEKSYDIMRADDIEGQEETGIGFDGDIQITPFNMREEMEEGHFDTEGNYHWKKEKQIKDNWMENIDWVKVKNLDNDSSKQNDSDSDDSSAIGSFDYISVYREMLDFIKPKETVAKAIRRLGGNRPISASERWKRKRAGILDSSEGAQEVTKLTELANKLLNKLGNMDIYQESYEHISSMVKEYDERKSKLLKSKRSYDDALDMYADDFDEKEKARSEQSNVKKMKLNETNSQSPEESLPKTSESEGFSSEEARGKLTSFSEKKETSQEAEGEVTWEYKWKDTDTDTHGPYSSSQMLAWVEEGFFKGNVLVRKCGKGGPFYSFKRIDFDLYI